MAFSVGELFNDYVSLGKKVRDFEITNFVKLSKSDCRKISASSVRCPEKRFNADFVYSEIKYSCCHGGKAYKSRSKGERPNQSTGKIGCPFVLRLKSTKDGQALEVMKFDSTHNHEITELEYKFHPRVRKVDQSTEQEIATHLQLNANRKLVQQSYKEKTGKNILMRDLHIIATRAKQNNKGVNNTTSEVQGISEWLKEQYPAIDCEFVVNEDNTFSGVFIQDAEMKSIFSQFPEVVLVDSTYKTNNLNMALYALLAVDGHGESHLICAFFVVDEDKQSLEDMLFRFKERNPKWTDICTVITDKDMTERLVFKRSFPQVNLQICLYHTLRTFSREVTMEKLKISSSERKVSLECLEKLAYSVGEEDYQDKYTSFVDKVPMQVQNYFNSNWHGIRVEWVKGLKSFHLKNDTTNRVESFFSKLKAYFSPRSSLKETLAGLMSCVDSLRSERQPSTLTTNQKFRKATGKLQKLASLIAQEGMSVYREQMAVIDQLIDFWQEGKRCTLVETVELQVDDSDEGDVQEEVGEIEDTNDVDVPEEIKNTNDVDVPEEIEDVPENQDDTNHDIDLSTVQLPPMGRRRGRPKGTVNRIIGLPRKKMETRNRKNSQKAKKGDERQMKILSSHQRSCALPYI